MIKHEPKENIVSLPSSLTYKGMKGRIKEIADRKGLKLNQVAERVKISNSQLSKINNGSSSVTIERVKKIAEVLEVNFLELIELPSNYGYITDSNKEVIGAVELNKINK